MRISDAIEPLLAARTRRELIDAVTASVGDIATSDGVRLGEGRIVGPSVTYRVLARWGPGPDPSPSIVRSPLSSPLIAEYVHSRFRGWVSMHDLLPGRAWTTHPFYLAVYRPIGLSAQITCALQDTGEVAYALSLNRAGKDFDQRERDRLEQYRRLAHSSWLRIEEGEAVQSVLTSLRDESDDDAMAVLTPGPITPRIAYCTDAMRRLLAQHIDLWEAIAHTAASADHPGARITTPADPGLRLVAVRTTEAVVVQALSPTLPELTSRERQILAELIAGRTAHTIGRRLAISERTVHKHLQHLYAKIGVHDRLGAVTLARRAALS